MNTSSQHLPNRMSIEQSRKALIVTNPLIVGDDQMEQIPWKWLWGIDEIDLRGCTLTRLPLGLSDLVNVRKKKLRMDSESLIGLSSLFVTNVNLEDLVKVLQEIKERKREEKCQTVKLLFVGDAGAGKTILMMWLRGEAVSGIIATGWYALCASGCE